ncbi:hypothetical protein RI367_003883 [Sorochytrium milnesiophthora]
MPVRLLEAFLQDRRVAFEPLQTLSGTRLGIDASSWLRRLLLSPKGKEPYTTPLGSTTPLHWRKMIKDELDQFRMYNIQPFFVFNGMTFRRDNTVSFDDTRPAKRATAWEQYEKGQVNSAQLTWATCGTAINDMVPYVMDIMNSLGAECMRAPYSPSAQLAYMLNQPQQLLHAVYGTFDMLMFDVDRAITTIDFEAGTFSWIDKPMLLNSLGVYDDQFLDCCIVAGFEYIPTFGPLSGNDFSWPGLLDMMRRCGSGLVMAQQMLDPQEQPKYMEHFCKVRAAIKHQLVLQTDGRVMPLNIDYAPSDLHEVFGPRLPNQLYQDLAVGLISPQTLTAISSGHVLEFPPLCNGEAAEYKKAIGDLAQLRAQAYNVITDSLNPALASRQLHTYSWFEPNVEHSMNQEKLAVRKLLDWRLGEQFLNEEMNFQNTDQIDWVFCLKATMKEAKAAKTVAPNAANGKKSGDPSAANTLKASSLEEAQALTLLSILKLRGFLDVKHQHTYTGKAFLQSATRPSDVDSTPFYDELFLAIELVKDGLLHGRPFSRVYGKAPSQNEQETQHLTLITRAASLLTPDFSGKSWAGPLDRDILSFTSVVRAVGKSLRLLAENLGGAIHLADEFGRDSVNVARLAQLLPFGQDYSSCTGILAKTYLNNVSRDGASIDGTLKTLASQFPAFADVKSELRKVWHFWDQLMFAVKRLRADGVIQDDIVTQFKQADEWLASRIS